MTLHENDTLRGRKMTCGGINAQEIDQSIDSNSIIGSFHLNLLQS